MVLIFCFIDNFKLYQYDGFALDNVKSLLYDKVTKREENKEFSAKLTKRLSKKREKRLYLKLARKHKK